MPTLSPEQEIPANPGQSQGDAAHARLGTGQRVLLRLRREFGRGETDDPVRFASHLALLLVAVGLLVFSQVNLPDWELDQPMILPAPTISPTPVTLSELVLSRGGPSAQTGPFTRSSVPFTTIPDRPRLDIEVYVVQPGDTVFGIAERYGLRPETIMWSNRELELNPDLLRVNDELVILPIDGVYHQVKNNDTLDSIAKKYKVQTGDILGYSWNQLSDASQVLVPGTYLIVPGGEKPYVPRQVSVYTGPVPEGANKGTGTFVWPASGSITQQYWNGHRALDVGGWVGAQVVASDSGYVIYAAWDNTGYGNLIIIDHGNGYRTYYSHLSRMFVRVGDSVGQGQRIGSVGSTGNSTGPHLHFEIRYNDILRNPFGFLR